VTSQVLQNAIQGARGNLTHAARALEISKRHILSLAKRHNLTGFAAELRRDAGQPTTGRPRK